MQKKPFTIDNYEVVKKGSRMPLQNGGGGMGMGIDDPKSSALQNPLDQTFSRTSGYCPDDPERVENLSLHEKTWNRNVFLARRFVLHFVACEEILATKISPI